MRSKRDGVEDVLSVCRVADFIEHINEGVLMMGLERDVEVDCGAGRRAAYAFPVRWNGRPRVLRVHVIPRWGCKAPSGKSGDGEQHKGLMVAHDGTRSRDDV